MEKNTGRIKSLEKGLDKRIREETHYRTSISRSQVHRAPALGGGSMETLPDDVVVEILLRVRDVAALFRCAATCKRCGLLVAEPSFLCHRWPEGVSRASSLLGFFSVQQPREEPTEGSSTATPISPYTPAPWSLPPRTGQPLPQFSWSSRHPGRAAHLAPRPSCWAQGPTGRTRQWTHEDHDPGIVRSNRR